MMEIVLGIVLLALSYIMGSIPSGLVVVRLTTGKDIRQVESGRTGGTNAMRAAGVWAGLATAILDVLKAAACVWLVQLTLPREAAPVNIWFEFLAPVMAILGHNYSIFLIERNEAGRIRLRGGAGGAPAVGGALGLWPPSVLIIVPIGAVILYFIGYASVATMGTALLATLIFVARAAMGASPWEYALYGLLAEALLVWALRPNIGRLLNGTERVVGYRARKKGKEGKGDRGGG
ncbi:MAG: glycerol-3-phosphate acyltransferase [Chloroflexi bacterium]|nr:glycerol-3-phosphate acyltransferase [Chloroflexota bacterium]